VTRRLAVALAVAVAAGAAVALAVGLVESDPEPPALRSGELSAGASPR
jgi:hypothetical protein